MTRVTLWFDAPQYAQLRAIFVDRYGPPTDQREEPVQTPGGGHFTNEILRWDGTTAVVSLRRYNDKITRGQAVIQTAADRAEELTRLGDALKRGKNDL